MTLQRITAIVILIFPVGLILALIWIIIKISDPKKPAFFLQKRVGKNGNSFLMWKVRTFDQIDYSDSIRGPIDPRITPIGKVIRKCHVDKLIQIVNVAKGSMGFIGPRPSLVTLSREREEKLRGYKRRYTVLPGITGLKQVSGRCVPEKELALDRLMIRKLPEVKFRLWIIHRTAWRMLKLKGDS